MSHHHAQARADFDRAHRRAALGGLLARLRRRPDGLLAYHEVRRGLAAAESYRGVRAVPVDRIVGSTDRYRDFDRAFRPRRGHCAGRWVSVARAHGEGKSLPPVQLYRVGDGYFVRDGHHRVSVARFRGQAVIDAEVVEVVVLGALPVAEPDVRPRADAGKAAVRRGRGQTAWPPLRRRAGGALVSLGHRLQGVALTPAAGDPTGVAG
jgi:hypothetical protein